MLSLSRQGNFIKTKSGGPGIPQEVLNKFESEIKMQSTRESQSNHIVHPSVFRVSNLLRINEIMNIKKQINHQIIEAEAMNKEMKGEETGPTLLEPLGDVIVDRRKGLKPLSVRYSEEVSMKNRKELGLWIPGSSRLERKILTSKIDLNTPGRLTAYFLGEKYNTTTSATDVSLHNTKNNQSHQSSSHDHLSRTPRIPTCYLRKFSSKEDVLKNAKIMYTPKPHASALPASLKVNRLSDAYLFAAKSSLTSNSLHHLGTSSPILPPFLSSSNKSTDSPL